jgi:hypothetical protein
MMMVGSTYALWFQELTIMGTINTGSWNGGGGSGACVSIQKSFDGAFTNATTGANITTPTDLIRIGAVGIITKSIGSEGIACKPPPEPNFPTRFLMWINVTNCGAMELRDIIVTDMLQNQFAPVEWDASVGTVSWRIVPGIIGKYNHSFLEWRVDSLASGENISIAIWLNTTTNPAGLYEPTTPSEDYLVNSGATVSAVSDLGILTATTETLVLEVGGLVQGNIARILTSLPYSTPWASDSISE